MSVVWFLTGVGVTSLLLLKGVSDDCRLLSRRSFEAAFAMRDVARAMDKEGNAIRQEWQRLSQRAERLPNEIRQLVEDLQASLLTPEQTARLELFRRVRALEQHASDHDDAQ